MSEPKSLATAVKLMLDFSVKTDICPQGMSCRNQKAWQQLTS
jgi:hypothetical protein